MNIKNKIFLLLFVFFSISAGVFSYSWWTDNKYKISTDNAYVRSSITTISSRISGYIDSVPALTNAKVKKDEVLVIFDTDTFEAEVKASKAAVEVARAKISTIDADFENIVEVTNAKINTINTDFNNIVEITNAKIYTIETDFKNILEVTKAKIKTIETNFKNISARIDLANTNIEAVTSKAAALSSELKLAEQNLSRIDQLYKKGSVSKAKYDKTLSSVNSTKHNLSAANAIIRSEKNKLEVILTEKQKIEAQKKELLANLETEQLKIEALKKELLANLETEQLKIEALKKELLASLETETQKNESQKNELIANLDNAKAKLKLSIINLESTKVISPIDGVIANRIAEPGVYVEDGWPLMAVVPIHDIWIIANFKETQVENIQVGQKVSITFDAFKHNPIFGKVHSIAPASSASFSLLPPQNASGNFVKVVQRVPVKITFDIPNEMMGRIVPGLSALVSVETNAYAKLERNDTTISSREQ